MGFWQLDPLPPFQISSSLSSFIAAAIIIIGLFWQTSLLLSPVYHLTPIVSCHHCHHCTIAPPATIITIESNADARPNSSLPLCRSLAFRLTTGFSSPLTYKWLLQWIIFIPVIVIVIIISLNSWKIQKAKMLTFLPPTPPATPPFIFDRSIWQSHIFYKKLCFYKFYIPTIKLRTQQVLFWS